MEFIKTKNHEIVTILSAGSASFIQCSLFYWCELGKNRLQAGKLVSLEILKTYAGFRIALLYIVSSRTLGFGIFESSLLALKRLKISQTQAHLYSASITGLLKPILLFPIETIKIQMQVNSVSLSEALKRLIMLQRKLKIESLLYLQVKNFISYFVWFETRMTIKKNFNIRNKHLHNFVAGAISSSTAFFLSSPFSTLKTLRQIGNIKSVRNLIKEEGMLRFHKGFGFHMVNIICGGGIFNTIYTLFTEKHRDGNIN